MTTRAMLVTAMCAATLALGAVARDARADSTALFYGRDVPRELLDIYARVVVEPDALPDAPDALERLMSHRARVFAYVSVGELARTARTRPRPAQVRAWALARNPAWNSDVMDLTSPGWRSFLIDQRVGRLWRAGFHGLFLDTLDSFHLADLSDDQNTAQIDALVTLIEQLHRRYPGIELIANRGFEILPRVSSRLVGIAAESLFDRWDPATRRYTAVPARDRQWLLARLTEARDRYHLPVTVIDYRPSGQRDRARRTARRIAGLGFDPWVTNADLTALGVGQPEVLPRQILVLYDGARHALADSPAARLITPIIEYEGYVPVFCDVQQRLPDVTPGRHAGIVSWFSGPVSSRVRARALAAWLAAAGRAGLRHAALGDLGFTPDRATLARLGLTSVTRDPVGDIAIESSAMIGFEAAPQPHRLVRSGVIASGPGVRAQLRLRDRRGVLRDPIVIGPWGGLAMAPYLLHTGYAGQRSWVVNPFAFLREALALPDVPALDVTTDSGHRVAMLHIDAAGASQPAELRGTPPAREVIRRLVAGHRLPHSTTDPALARSLAHVTYGDPGLVGAGANLTRWNPSITRLTPHAVPGSAAGSVAVAWPIADEDGYRADDGGSRLGFRRVIETLELTDQRRRLKPIAITYHAYSGASAASRRALAHIYAWLSGRELAWVHASEHADAVREFYRATLARTLDGRSFRIGGTRRLRTVRIPRGLGWPAVTGRGDVVAVRERPQGRYATLGAGPGATLTLTAAPPTQPIIIGASGRVLAFDAHDPHHIRLRARGHVPVTLVIAGLPTTGCTLIGPRYRVRGRWYAGAVSAPHERAALRFDVPHHDTGQAVLRCR